jgi:hypothetical protein
VLADDPHRSDYDAQDQCEERQQIFFDSIHRNPRYGKYVHQLTWTCFSRRDEENEERQISEEPMWDTFKALCNVKHLDFASLASYRERIAPPPLLFPRVTHLRLSGQMSFAIVLAFINSLNPTQLKSLECNNLQDFGSDEVDEGLGPASHPASLLESKDSSGNEIRYPGLMSGHLQRLTGRCSSLRHLILRSVGQDAAVDTRWSSALDAARYDEWALFVDSVRSTLESLTIDQGMETEEKEILRYRSQALQIGRPMDERLSKHILPTLSNGNWPHLQQLRIFGVGTRPRDVDNFLPGFATASYVQRVLSEAQGLRGVKVEIQEEATKTFYFPEYRW